MSLYADFNSASYKGDCTFCRAPIEYGWSWNLFRRISVAHEGQGIKHPSHRDCTLQYVDFKISNNFSKIFCPTGCGVEIDPKSLNKWTDKYIFELREITNDAFQGIRYAFPFTLGVKGIQIAGLKILFPFSGLTLTTLAALNLGILSGIKKEIKAGIGYLTYASLMALGVLGTSLSTADLGLLVLSSIGTGSAIKTFSNKPEAGIVFSGAGMIIAGAVTKSMEIIGSGLTISGVGLACAYVNAEKNMEEVWLQNYYAISGLTSAASAIVGVAFDQIAPGTVKIGAMLVAGVVFGGFLKRRFA